MTTTQKEKQEETIMYMDIKPLMLYIYDIVFEQLTNECSTFWYQWEKDQDELENLVKNGALQSVPECDMPRGEGLLEYIYYAYKNLLREDFNGSDGVLWDYLGEIPDVVCEFFISNKDNPQSVVTYTKHIAIKKYGVNENFDTFSFIDPKHLRVSFLLFKIVTKPGRFDHHIKDCGIGLVIKKTLDCIIKNLEEDKEKPKPKSAKNI